MAAGVRGAAAPAEELIAPAEAVFRTEARLVQVFASVTDSRGRHVDDLPREQFTLLDNGARVPIAAFENSASGVSLALTLDTTGSMQARLPALKNAALRLIRALRPIDAVAVYSLRGGFTELQKFTTDKEAAARAVLSTEAAGLTALYDALVRVNRDLAARVGKKAIVVFTDGNDNFSTLTPETAIRGAKTAGVPIYTIAQGPDVDQDLQKQLAEVARATGGVAFNVASAGEMRTTFERVLEDLLHGYLLAFQPPAVEGNNWRTVQVTLRNGRGLKVRAREGYYPR